jgi:hypothetical protein
MTEWKSFSVEDKRARCFYYIRWTVKGRAARDFGEFEVRACRQFSKWRFDMPNELSSGIKALPILKERIPYLISALMLVKVCDALRNDFSRNAFGQAAASRQVLDTRTTSQQEKKCEGENTHDISK